MGKKHLTKKPNKIQDASKVISTCESLNKSEVESKVEPQIDVKTTYAKTLAKIYILHKEGMKLNQQLKSGRVNVNGFTIEYDIDNKFENESTNIWKRTTQDSLNKIFTKEQALINKLSSKKFLVLSEADRNKIQTDFSKANEKKTDSQESQEDRAYINKIILVRK